MDNTNSTTSPEREDNMTEDFSTKLLDGISKSENKKDAVMEKTDKKKLKKKLKKTKKEAKKHKHCEKTLSKKNKKLLKENTRLTTELSFRDELDEERIARIKAECQRDTAVYLLGYLGKRYGVEPALLRLPESTENEESQK